MSATRPPDHRHRRPLTAVGATVLVAALGLAGCGRQDGGTGDGASAREGDVYEIVVPYGTQERLSRGETVDVMPSRLEFQVGDTLRIRNDDIMVQTVGPYVVGAGEVFELRYGKPGRYEGMCPLSADKTYEIVVTP
jgi:hypothetical protein